MPAPNTRLMLPQQRDDAKCTSLDYRWRTLMFWSKAALDIGATGLNDGAG